MKKILLIFVVILVSINLLSCSLDKSNEKMEKVDNDKGINESVEKTQNEQKDNVTESTDIVSTINEISEVQETTEEIEAQIQVYPEPLVYEREAVESLSDLQKAPYMRYELRSYDISKLKVPDDIMNNFVFDSKTKWPEKLPEFFDLQRIIEYGKNPGLNVRKLHQQGITGKGVNVGIIDGRLLVDHKEFKDNIRVYEETFEMEGPAFYHSTPITSILVGDSNGVAPDVGVYYMAYLDENIDYEDGYLELAKAIERLVEINGTLSEDEKIKVISISSGWNPESENAKGIYEAIEKAKAENIFVISARMFETHELFFEGVKRNPIDDPDNVSLYFYSKPPNGGKDILLVPMDARWMASSTGQEDYVMYSNGAWSMAIPYISGLYALACQVNPDITPDEFWDIAISTGDLVKQSSFSSDYKDKNAKIVNPVKLINTIDSYVK